MDFAHIPDRIPMLLTAGELRALIDAEIAEAVSGADAAALTAQERLKDLQRAHEVLSDDHAAALAENKRLSDELTALKAAMNTINVKPAILPQPPVVVEPDKPQPLPMEYRVFPFAGAYIEDERAVDNVTQAQGRAAAMVPVMEFAADSALTDYILFANQYDIQHGELMRTMRRLNKRWWQSPIQIYFNEKERHIEHLKRLYDAGVYGVFVDDAQTLTPDMMTELLDRIEKHMPGVPTVASFAALFDDSAYPKSRYIDSRQWFTRQQESEANWFPKWEEAQDAQIYTADVYRRSSGYMHTPERVEQSFNVALPFVQGIAWYSLLNKNWNHMKDHQEATAKDDNAKTMWNVIRNCTAVYMAKYEAAR